MLDPAKTVIEICGGVDAVAKITGRDKSRVHRWTYPKERGGTGGLIPSDVQQDLLDAAFVLGLRPEHFFVRIPLGLANPMVSAPTGDQAA